MSIHSLRLTDLEAFDPAGGRKGGAERRWLCPLCHGERRPDESHRCLCVNTQSGAWNCKRCGAKGLLMERRLDMSLPSKSRSDRARTALIRAFGDPTSRDTKREVGQAAPRQTAYDFSAQMRVIEPLPGTPGADYLASRGISADSAHCAGARHSPGFLGRPSVVFPLRDGSGVLVGASARCLDDRPPSKRTIKRPGQNQAGVFQVPGALQSEPLVIVEAPIDALSLLEAGILAVAVNGTACPEWLVKHMALKRALLGFDRDSAGDQAAERLSAKAGVQGTIFSRLRPPAGCKDWNEALLAHGAEALRSALSSIGQVRGRAGSQPSHSTWGRRPLPMIEAGSAPIPVHLLGLELAVWNNCIAESWAWKEWVTIHARDPDSPVFKTVGEAIRYVIDSKWRAPETD